jgi:hypothetical protein
MSSMKMSIYYDLKRRIYSKGIKKSTICKGRVCKNGSLMSDRGGSLFQTRNIIF